MPSLDTLLQFFSQASVSRSTAMQPLLVLLLAMLAALAYCATAGAPWWFLLACLVILAIGFLVFLVIFADLAKSNPDALRSEKYNLTKLSLEKSTFGDDTAGLLPPDQDDDLPAALPAPDPGANI